MNFDCGIYKITLPSGKSYIGSAVSISNRWRTHRALLRHGNHHCAPLQHAFNKYGEIAMVFAKIAFVPREELLMREQEQFDAHGFDNLYNILPIAGRTTGRVIPADMRARLRAALLGRKFSPETIDRMRNAQTGRKQSAESVARRAEKMRGHVTSQETRTKIRNAQLGRSRKESPNTSGFIGVIPAGNRWRAQYGAVYLGYHITPEAAASAIESYKRDGSIRTGRSNSKSGFKGVSPHGTCWQASARVGGKRHHLGTFDTPEAANAAIIAFKAKLNQDQ